MDNSSRFNVVVLGVSCFDGMASSMRVRNLLETTVFKDDFSLHNLIYKVDAHGLPNKRGRLKGINYLVVSASSILSVFSFTWQGIRFLRNNKSASKKNILYHYQYIDIKNIFLLLYAKSIGYKIVLDIVENNNYYTTFTNLKSRLKIATSLRFLKLTPRIADYVITISGHLKTLMTDVCKNKIPITLIPITVNLSRFVQLEFEAPEKFKIFYGGSFGSKDGLEYLIKAFEKICENYDNVELVMTGRASKQDFNNLKSYLSKSNTAKKIKHLGFLDNDLYYKTLNSCQIFCMTRTNSKFANAGFPFKLGEILATGKAVIATKVGDVPNYLENGLNALLVEPESTVELTEAISYFLNNPSEIYTYGKQARIVAEKNFDTNFWSEKLFQIFKEI